MAIARTNSCLIERYALLAHLSMVAFFCLLAYNFFIHPFVSYALVVSSVEKHEIEHVETTKRTYI